MQRSPTIHEDALLQDTLELAVIVPTFNEAPNVERLLERLSVALVGIAWEVVFVDDDSPDGTAEVVRAIAVTNRRVRIVHRVGRRGLSGAVIEGMLASAAPVLAVIDGDLQHDEAILPELYFQVASGQTDIAVGSRYVDGGGVGDWSAGRHRASQWATQLGKAALGVSFDDPMSGFFALSRQALMPALPHLSGIGYKVLLDIVASSPQPPRVTELGYTFRTREHGVSKAGALVAIEYLALLADKTIGRFVPLRLLSFLIVGALGLGVQMSVLGIGHGLGLTFLLAETVAVLCAMTFNFFLNNTFTYHDRRLRSWRVLTGLLSYYAICAVGAIANVGIGTYMNGQDGCWWLAGLAGILIGAIWNFAASALVTWR